MGPAQLSALSVLVFGGARTLGELAEAERVTAPTITRIVQALRRGGYVRLRRCAEDARTSIVEASPKGGAALKRAREARLDVIEGLLARSSRADIERLAGAIEAVFGESRSPP